MAQLKLLPLKDRRDFMLSGEALSAIEKWLATLRAKSLLVCLDLLLGLRLTAVELQQTNLLSALDSQVAFRDVPEEQQS